MTTYGIIGLGRVGTSIAAKLTENRHEVRWVSDAAARSAVGEPATLEVLKSSDVIVESVVERWDDKIAVLVELAGTSAPVLTTTSSFTIAELAAASGLGDRLGGFHYLPSYGGRLAELTTPVSAPDVRAAAATLADELGIDIIDAPDRPGRISRRLLVPFLENVLRAVDLEIASPADIDRVVQLGLGHAVGPLQRLREAGIDDHRAAAAILSRPASGTNA